jgi:hypothetical protein
MTGGNLAALTQTNTKRLLAYSSIAHVGYMLLALVAMGTAQIWSPGFTDGFKGILVYLLVYTFMNLGVFAVITSLRQRNVIGDELDDLAGLYSRAPVEAVLMPPEMGDLRIVLRQRDGHDAMMRSHSPANMGDYFVIGAWQDGRPLPVEIHYDKVIWSGLAWATGEIRHDDMAPGTPIRVRLSAPRSDPSLHLQGRVFSVQY